ncbi:MAG: tRNA (guanosine(46)-N7)-methyltransferase TrmB [Ruminococcus sp.]|nr:tRNA (guanosine(46)-N7)-methyltransferase TrmB [Ruminococcus sp.]
MRRKTHLLERLDACSDVIINMDRENRDFSVKDDKNLLDIDELFGRCAPLYLEIGCGKGRFICEAAKANSEYNFLAVEKASNVLVTAAESVQEQGIENVKFLRGAAEYLDCYIPKNSVERIYLNFSCPYPKKSYASHRLTHRQFLEIYQRLLKKGEAVGEIHMKTDNMQLFEFSIEELSQCGWAIKNVSLDLHNSDFEGNIMTEYEERFSSEGAPIYRLEAYKL